MHCNDNQTLSLRVVDPIADDGVWAIIDDGCNIVVVMVNCGDKMLKQR